MRLFWSTRLLRSHLGKFIESCKQRGSGGASQMYRGHLHSSGNWKIPDIGLIYKLLVFILKREASSSLNDISRKQVIRTDTAALSGLELEVTSGEAAPHRTRQRNNPRFCSYEGLCRLQKRFSFKKAKLATMYFLQALINLLPPRWPRWGTLDVSVKAFVTSWVLVFWLGLGQGGFGDFFFFLGFYLRKAALHSVCHFQLKAHTSLRALRSFNYRQNPPVRWSSVWRIFHIFIQTSSKKRIVTPWPLLWLYLIHNEHLCWFLEAVLFLCSSTC